MNLTQRELIFQEFERIASQDDAVRSYVEHHSETVEPFFVKNLENVQGDERDVILISTVYGPTANGQVYQRFGPVNSKVGHRRLNVLFTRAKRAIILVTSLRPDDIRVSASSNAGVQTLQAYLNYAAAGAEADNTEGGEPDSDFEIFVADRLRAAGYEVVPQVGVEFFRIDIGVRSPGTKHIFLAGIECDGARYHTGYTVRDRDRIRQDILEGLGWHIIEFGRPIGSTIPIERPRGSWSGSIAAARSVSKPPRGRRRQQLSLDRHSPSPPTRPPPGQSPICRSERTSDGPVANRPRGQHRQLDDIDYYEVERGLFEIWTNDRRVGEVERVESGDIKPARLYGGRVELSKPRYRGSWLDSEVWFESDDIYQAIRRVAHEARTADSLH